MENSRPISPDSLRFKFRLFVRSRLALVGLLFLLFVFVLAALGPALSPYDPLAIDFSVKLDPPSRTHLFGTDNFGRDLMSRIFSGAHHTVMAALISVLIGLFIGTPLGVLSGYLGKKTDLILMRIMDVLLAFPPLLLAMAIVSGLGPSLSNASIAIGVSYVPHFARMARSRAIHVRSMEYVEAAVALGAPRIRILVSHVLPNCLTPIIVQATVYAGYGILWVAGLSFIGLGARIPTPEWGLMIAEGRQYIVSGEWWVTIFPGVFVMLGVTGFTLIGDGLREVLNPKLRVH